MVPSEEATITSDRLLCCGGLVAEWIGRLFIVGRTL
jgi:hypothetical protein